MRWGLSLVLMTVACGGLAFDPTYQNVQTQVFDRSCTFSTCHSDRDREGELALEPAFAYDELIDVPADDAAAQAEGLIRVVPGNPEASFLMLKLRRPVDPKYGDPMPQASLALDDDEVCAIEEWIRQGAKR